MKKILVILGLFICVNLLYAQTPSATLSIPYVEISDIPIGGNVYISIIVDTITVPFAGFQISLEFNPAIISWNGTNTNPAPGVEYLHPNLTPLGPDWLWSSLLGGELAFSWVDPSWVGVTINPGDTLITLIFTYLGGLAPGQSSPVIFGEKTGIGDILPDNLTLINGLIYNGYVSIVRTDIKCSIIWSDKDKIYILSPELSGEITVLNLMGLVVSKRKMKPGITEIPILGNNMYLVVNVLTSDYFISKKVYIK